MVDISENQTWPNPILVIIVTWVHILNVIYYMYNSEYKKNLSI